MKKNQNGVTLIALAVTIIVMLILAGATMSMLTGNSGIMTNAKKSSAANEEADAYEKMGQAFNAIQLEAESNAALSSGYDASNDLDKYTALAQSEIGSQATVVTSVPTTFEDKKFTIYKDETHKSDHDDPYTEIIIIYKSKTFALPITGYSAEEKSKQNQYPMLKAVINFRANVVSYTAPVTSVVDANKKTH
jgi:type II secretory pathway pseudopilin PulG